MANGSLAPNVRFVTCPRCRVVLPESTDIPKYICGGCGVILQAKQQKNELKVTGPDQQKRDELPPDEINTVSEDKDLGGVRAPSSAENSVEFEEPRDQRVSVDDADFMPKEEMSVFTDDDQLGAHNCSNDEDNGERDKEPIGILSSTELESYGGSSPIDERNSENEASVEGSLVPLGKCGEETKRSDGQAHKMVETVSSSVIDGEEKPSEAINPTNATFSTGAYGDRFKRISPHAYDRGMSIKTTTSTEYVDPVSDFSGTLAETPRSLARSFRRYHNGDLPSFDAPEIHNLNGYGKEANSTLTQERLGQEKYRMNNNIQYPEMKCREPLSSSHGVGFVRAGARARAGIVEPPAPGSEGRYWRRSDRGELPLRIPANHLQQRSSYDYGVSLNRVPMYSRFNPCIRSSDVPTNTEHEKMKLLRMVHELEDQLKRTCDLEGIPGERMAFGSHLREKPGGVYYSRDRIDDDYLQMGLPAFSRRDGQDSRWHYRSQYPKRPFTAEIAGTSRQPNNYYYHPDDLRRSEPLPPPAAAHNGKLYGIRHDKGIYSPYSSCPSSPQHYMDYGSLPYGYGTRSNDEIYDREREYEKHREGKPMVQSRVMAAAGGAPWIICSHCNRLLQLPTDFLLLKKKCHRLRCGSCSVVLKFSLQNRRQLVPYVRRTEAPPPSEADEHRDSLRAYMPTLGSCPNGFVQAETVSYSDDIGMSYSTEGDPACLATPHGIGNESGSSPLHQLMGYSSVSQVFKGPKALRKGGTTTSSIVKRP
ncbi:hypothetical protein MLD38_018835 [Melastoma candidum]|uniref:Uncharacterized protein n=1 Tax=Melastoma candidum TaxID=119954 RepID=A0ACB9QV79_9MYRT|nr:hypothetical protein MLD38_018835 [Melastoma candidum]